VIARGARVLATLALLAASARGAEVAPRPLDLRSLGAPAFATFTPRDGVPDSVIMAMATDAEIVERARQEGRAVVTLDADFHALLVLTNASTPSVLRVRIEGLRAEPLAALVASVVSVCSADLVAGAMVTVDDAHNVRVRVLPLVRE